jgi:hypothetical protein
MDEDDIDGPRRVAELKARHRAAPFRQVDQPRSGGIR